MGHHHATTSERSHDGRTTPPRLKLGLFSALVVTDRSDLTERLRAHCEDHSRVDVVDVSSCIAQLDGHGYLAGLLVDIGLDSADFERLMEAAERRWKNPPVRLFGSDERSLRRRQRLTGLRTVLVDPALEPRTARCLRAARRLNASFDGIETKIVDFATREGLTDRHADVIRVSLMDPQPDRRGPMLGISPKTFLRHLENISKRTGIRGQRALVAAVLRGE